MQTLTLSSPAGRWVMISCILASSMAFIDATALNAVLPSLQKGFNASAADLFWILNAYLLMLAALILIGGSLGDQLGRKKIFIIGIAVFTCGSAACGFAPDVIKLITFRAVQGIGGALMIPGSLSLISSSIGDKEKGKAIGTWSAFTTMVTMGGPALGGALADAGLWRYIFFINIPLGILAIIILLFKVKESNDNNNTYRIDYPGAVTIALGLALLTFGFLRVPVVGFHSWQVYSSLAFGLILLAFFILIEYKSGHPMMPLSLFSNSTFGGANLLTFFLYAALGACMLFLSLNLVQVQGYSQLQSGLTFLPFTVMMIAVTRFAGTLSDRYGPRLFLIAGPAVTGCGFFLLSLVKQTHGASQYFTTFFPGIILMSLGMSFTVSPLTTAVMGAVSDRFSGTASGVNNAISRIAAVFTNAIFGALAVLFFSGALQSNLRQLMLSPQTQQAVMKQAVNLGDAQVPQSADRKTSEQIKVSYKKAFIAAYSIILKACAALAYTGAFMAFIFIKNGALKERATPGR